MFAVREGGDGLKDHLNRGNFMKKLIGIVTIGVVLGSAAVFADPDPSRLPMDRAIESVKKNIEKNPDVEGLRNARERLLENRRRQTTGSKNQAPGQQKHGPSSAEHKETGGDAKRTEVVDRVERAELPDRVERVERPERVDRPEHPVHPGHPQH